MLANPHPNLYCEAVALTPDDRQLLHLLISTPAPLTDLAKELGTDILTLSLRVLDPTFQAALGAVQAAATALAQTRALAGHSAALTALTDAAAPENPDLTERRRAATTLLRAAPMMPVPPAACSEAAGVSPATAVPQAPCPVPLPACSEAGSAPAQAEIHGDSPLTGTATASPLSTTPAHPRRSRDRPNLVPAAA